MDISVNASGCVESQGGGRLCAHRARSRKPRVLSHLLMRRSAPGRNGATAEMTERAHNVCARAVTHLRTHGFQLDVIGGRMTRAL